MGPSCCAVLSLWIGQRIVAEALSRGHHVTAFTRHESRIPKDRGQVTWKVADALDSTSLVRVMGGLDVLISSYGPGNASQNFQDTVERSIRNPETYVTAARALLEALQQYPSLRLIVVGGAGSLEVKPGLQLIDSPDSAADLKKIGVPEEYSGAVLFQRKLVDPEA